MGRLHDLLPAMLNAVTGGLVVFRVDWFGEIPIWATVILAAAIFAFVVEDVDYVLRRKPAD